jgi:hypothetical protein
VHFAPPVKKSSLSLGVLRASKYFQPVEWEYNGNVADMRHLGYWDKVERLPLVASPNNPATRRIARVKCYLTAGQGLRLLSLRSRCSVISTRSAKPTEYALMNTIDLIARFGQAAFAVIVTIASVLVFQIALLAG